VHCAFGSMHPTSQSRRVRRAMAPGRLRGSARRPVANILHFYSKAE
jgi:hypothetical protein